MMWPYYGGGFDAANFIWMSVMMLVVLAVLVALGVWLARTLSSGAREADSALDILRKRFAAGEISQEEFESRRRALQG